MISIVIPVYNESGSIGIVLEKVIKQKNILRQVSDVEIIVVNDCSEDNTAAVVSRYDGEVRLINLTSRLGCGDALKEGFKAASGGLITILDGDCTYPPEAIIDLYNAKINSGADLVVGSRFLNKNQRVMSAVRYLGNKFFVFLINFLSRSRITDAASGMRLFSKDILDKIEPLPAGLDFSVAMTVRALFKKIRIAEMPISYNQRVGDSKLNIVRDGMKFLLTILSIAVFENNRSGAVIKS